MRKFFDEFANSGPGSWIISGLATLAFFILAKFLVLKLPDMGLPGSVKAIVNFA